MSLAAGQCDFFSAREQFRMNRLQVYNWGTFDGLHEIPIAERGFLFVGRSGSGKTTLLDAFSALLIKPQWVDFNAAAREADRRGRDRNLVTYVRGAWAEQQDGGSGEIATKYLRTGTTWSALALSYQNTLGQIVVLAQLFWLRGSANGTGDVGRHFFILERPFDLLEIEDFGLDLRKLKQILPEAAHYNHFNPYCERFRRLLGIENELALRLLHKTQSAKNLGDLNTFLREFMLELPQTFEVAETLVNEFAELNEAHQAVVIARDQIGTLIPAREEYQHREHKMIERGELDELRLGVDRYRDITRIRLLEERIAELSVQAQGQAGEVQRAQAAWDMHNQVLHDLESQHREMGGDRIERLQNTMNEQVQLRAEKESKRKQAREACHNLGWVLPEDPLNFAELQGQAHREINDGQLKVDDLRARQLDLATRKKGTETEFAETRKEVEALRRQPSNIPARMLRLRSEICAALNFTEDVLPFAGELIEVLPEEESWCGAIERVLHGFALSMLVGERHYTALSNYLNTAQLGERLVYFLTAHPDTSPLKPARLNLLPRKLKLKDGPHKAWLDDQLRRHFDYACVDSMQAFRQEERALTREGQIRHGKSRHEKDDRHDVQDRKFWVLGFDNRSKRELFEKQAQELGQQISVLESQLCELTKQEKNCTGRAMQCQTLITLKWNEIDLLPLVERIAQLEQQLAEARFGNTALQEIEERLIQQRQRAKEAEAALQDARINEQQTKRDIGAREVELGNLQHIPTVELTPPQRIGLDARIAALRKPLTLENLEKQTNLIKDNLGEEISALVQECFNLEKTIEKRFLDFMKNWGAEAGDLDATLASAPDFLAKLQRLEIDGLPRHEERFFKLLKEQSHQNLVSLNTHLTQARKEILLRMELVNEGLSQAPFNEGTYLRIGVTDRQLPNVREFKQEISQALSHAWTEDRQEAEERFIILRRIVEHLASQEPEWRSWRQAVLDVRQHVEFIGRELDQEGHEVEIYRSGAGKSGGQRQKLATTCLAAALRYQLGGSDHQVPMYAPVVLDEAFDKADNEFTALAMNIFDQFKFQMIVATPLKSVMTLEPFIGGACFVDISERRCSSVLLIEYDESRRRLKLPENVHGDSSTAIS